jgi:hypothetical protein
MNDRSKHRYSRWLWALGGLVGIILVALVLVVGPWLFTRQSDHGLTTEQMLTAKNDVRNTLVQILGGLALAGGLIVTYNTYLQNRTEQNRTYKQRQAEQVNELYAKAVEQLGSDKAPVRLGALYALERLAQDNPEQQPTAVDVFCAYLRMPYDIPGEPPANDAQDAEYARFTERTQELLVRRAAQEILAKHLKPTDDFFWKDSRINLSGAVLINLDFGSCRMSAAHFLRTQFRGPTIFHYANFDGDANFDGADFDPKTGAYVGDFKWWQADMGFDCVRFNGDVSFYEFSFRGSVTFNASTFCKHANFSKATFMFEPQSKIFPSAERRPNVRFHDARVAHEEISGSRWPVGWGVLPDPDRPGWDILHEIVAARNSASAAPTE